MAQAGAEAARLRVVVARLHTATDERMELERELESLRNERGALFSILQPRPTGSAASSDRAAVDMTRGDWRPERIRDALLWLGSILLIISAITFAVVAWARLSPYGRAGMLVAATLVAAGLTRSVRGRLRPTAEALAALTIGMTLVDWRALERTSLAHGISVATWWALGLSMVGVGAFVVARRSELTVVRVAPAIVLPAAAAASLLALSPTLTQGTLGLAVITTLLIVAGTVTHHHRHEAAVVTTLDGLAILGQLATIGLAAAAVIEPVVNAAPDPVPTLMGPALAVLAIAVPPAGRVFLRRLRPSPFLDLFTTIVWSAPIAALAVAAGPGTDGFRLLALIACLAGALTLGARLVPTPWQTGARAAGVLGFAVPLIGAIDPVREAWSRSLSWLSDGWTGSLEMHLRGNFGPMRSAAIEHAGPVVIILIALAIAAAAHGRLFASPKLGVERAVVGVASGLALAVAVTALDPTIGIAFGVHLTVGLACVIAAIAWDAREPRRSRDLLVTAAVVLVPAVGWAAVSVTATIVALALITLTGIAASIRVRPTARPVAAALAGLGLMAEAGVAAHALEARDAIAGFVVLMTAGALLLSARFLRPLAFARVDLEVASVIGGATGLLLAADESAWRTIALVVLVPVMVAAARLTDERADGYGTAAAIAAVGATFSVVARAPVMVELFSIPSALAALVIARIGIHDTRRASWATVGPGLLIGFAPSVAVVVTHGGTLRPVLVLVAAGITIAIGVRSNLRAPIDVGGLSALVLAIDGIAPVAAGLPRWLLIGTIGALALWAGATADRRLDQLRRWRTAVDDLA
ncbi:MAG: hypothetical protein ABIP21_00010 [Acidimicrobiia bacterium]